MKRKWRIKKSIKKAFAIMLLTAFLISMLNFKGQVTSRDGKIVYEEVTVLEAIYLLINR